MTYPKRDKAKHPANSSFAEQNPVLLYLWSLAPYMGPPGFPVKLTVYFFSGVSLYTDIKISASDKTTEIRETLEYENQSCSERITGLRLGTKSRSLPHAAHPVMVPVTTCGSSEHKLSSKYLQSVNPD